MKPTVLDLFSGCGGFSYGFVQAGYEIVGFVEIWKPAIQTYKINHPNAEHIWHDITQVTDEQLYKYRNKIDVIIGGPPCQGFSICGNRNTNDPRNKLYKHYLRFVMIINPETIVMENVKGLLSMKDADGEKVIHKITNDLISLGYSVCYKVLNAVHYGVAQNRERLIIIGKRLDLFPEPKPERKTVLEAINGIPDYEDDNDAANTGFSPIKETIERIRNLKEGERLCPKYNRSRQRIYGNQPAPTVMTKPLFIHPIEDRLMTPRELARLQSFPDNFGFIGSKTAMVKQIGNAVPPKMARVLADQLIK